MFFFAVVGGPNKTKLFWRVFFFVFKYFSFKRERLAALFLFPSPHFDFNNSHNHIFERDTLFFLFLSDLM